MSLLSSLLKIGGLAAAPFTGGTSLLATGLGAAGDVANVFGGQQAGTNNAKLAQGQMQGLHDRNAIDLYGTQQNAQTQAGQLDLQRKGFETANRSASAKQALIGALLGGGVTPTSISPSGASGGLLRSLNGNPEALAALKALGAQGSAAQVAPLQFQGGQMLTAPKLAELPKIDTGGGFLSTLAKLGQLAGAVSPYLRRGEESGGGGASSVLPGGQY